MTNEQLNIILESHLHWIREDAPGWESMKADLSGINLSGVNLYGANLYGANFFGANLSGANLSRANLSRANLSQASLFGANFYGANLYGANLTHADLFGANLYEANLYESDLSEAMLYGANLSQANLSKDQINKYFPICCPEHGSFIGWKKAGSGKYIIKLEIQEEAKRSSAYGRKCRCSSAKVLAIENLDGSCAKDITQVVSRFDQTFLYKLGQIVSVNNFDEDRRNECSTGIHFFITRQEAVDYEML
jgi:hypothetical protein